MARFTVRIEVSDAEWEDYNEMYGELETRGFTKTIIASNNVVKQLPDAEYNFDGSKTIEEVLSLAKEAAETTKKKFKILVTESKSRKWHNLDDVE